MHVSIRSVKVRLIIAEVYELPRGQPQTIAYLSAGAYEPLMMDVIVSGFFLQSVWTRYGTYSIEGPSESEVWMCPAGVCEVCTTDVLPHKYVSTLIGFEESWTHKYTFYAWYYIFILQLLHCAYNWRFIVGYLSRTVHLEKSFVNAF